MAEHEIIIALDIDSREEDNAPVKGGDLFQDVSDIGGGSTYIVAHLHGKLALICLDDGAYYTDLVTDDPFEGDRADFRRIPGDRTITIE
jgi:hypothetical protein